MLFSINYHEYNVCTFFTSIVIIINKKTVSINWFTTSSVGHAHTHITLYKNYVQLFIK